jgi:RHH-type proline utilization regulon transcriptional repressor/proline dehydrogenase/delta 1-pyrroline-5-carboxylate dehydrogenase
MSKPAKDLEDRILAIGREIFARVRAAEGFSPSLWLDQAFMNVAMADELVKAQLFRFVDCLPALRTPRQVAQHLQEYLEGIADRLPPMVGRALSWLPGDGAEGIASTWTSSLIAKAAHFNVRRLARKFIAAGDLEEAVAAARRLRRQHLAFTLDLLGEAVIAENEAGEYQSQYLRLVDALPGRVAELPEDALIDRDARGSIRRANFSIKLSSLFSQFDPIDPRGTTDAVAQRLRPILRLARERGAFVNLDMEQFAFKNLTIEIFKSILGEAEFRDWPDVGIAIQAYLRDTENDLRSLADWAKTRGTPIWVRLVKGAYWDFETIVAAQNGWPIPVFTDKFATDAGFESAAAFLIEHRDLLRPALATHNVRSIAAAMALAERNHLEPGDLEFQMLYGMAEPIKAALADMNWRVRVYMPVGKLLPGMAYLVRRLLENTSNESFLRAEFIQHLPQEQLLMNPLLRTRPPSPAPQAAPFANEPPTDFSRADARETMTAALNEVRETDRKPLLLIGGKRVEPGHWIESINPSHKSQTVGKFASATVKQAHQAVAAAKAALNGWRETAAHDRAELLRRVAKILRRDRFKIAALQTFECGKPWREADADLCEAIDFCMYYAWQMELLAAPAGHDLPGEENQWSYDARGVAVVIAPWNFPLAILCGMTAAAIVAGNPVVMKPAEQSSLVAAALAEAFVEAGAPAGVLNYLPGIGEEIGPALTGHPDVAMIVFTGSRAVGLSINQEASKTPPGQDHVKRIVTEMGGKNAIIIDEDADLDEAVAAVAASAFGYSGQKCSACSRAIALAGVHDAFVSRLIEAARSMNIAPAEDPACRVGPVIDQTAFERIRTAIERGKGEAKLFFAGDVGALADEGYYIAPHIFAEVAPRSFLAREEIFGPVLSVMRARNLDDALAIANGVDYALTGGVFSRSLASIARCRREFRVGNLYINRKITGALVGRQPFGGFKLSGTGTQAGGPDYLRHFVLPRCVTENTMRRGFVPREPSATNGEKN